MPLSLLLTVATFLTGAFAPTAQAQATLASNTEFGPASLPTADKDAADPTTEVVLSGKITNPAGPLPGAVIIPKETKQMAVINAEGEFQFVVPAGAPW